MTWIILPRCSLLWPSVSLPQPPPGAPLGLQAPPRRPRGLAAWLRRRLGLPGWLRRRLGLPGWLRRRLGLPGWGRRRLGLPGWWRRRLGLPGWWRRRLGLHTLMRQRAARPCPGRAAWPDVLRILLLALLRRMVRKRCRGWRFPLRSPGWARRWGWISIWP